MKRKLAALAVSLLPALPGAHAAAARMNDYAQGIAIAAPPGRPVVEVALPDAVYRGVTRTDLGDLRVFNAASLPVPHAICAAPDTPAPSVSWVTLPVVPLRDARRPPSGATRVDVQTSAGTQINVQESEPAAAQPARPRAHVIDARSVEEIIRAIQFEWTSPDGASEARVRIEASEDLDRWETVVGASTLLDAGEGGQRLSRQRIPLPHRRYRYLRVERTDGGPPLQISSVQAEQVIPAAEPEPVWFIADPLASDDPKVLEFDAARLAPVRYARLRLPQDNSSVRVELQSRAVETAVWRTQWTGEMYLVLANGQRRLSPPARIDVTRDRYWRALLVKDELFHEPPMLELGYRPEQLRFLAQGAAPYTLAFGSRRTETPAALACANLLADVDATEMQELMVAGELGASRPLGGDAALQAPPRRTPVRLFVLWGVLIVGVAVLVTMAVTLLQRLKGRDEG